METPGSKYYGTGLQFILTSNLRHALVPNIGKDMPMLTLFFTKEHGETMVRISRSSPSVKSRIAFIF